MAAAAAQQHITGSSAIECKVVLLGKENVGKTCIMERFIHERFISSADSQSTVGVVFGAKLIIINGRSIRLSVWDTAGSERFTSISRLYYRNAKAAIVCYDITDATSLDRCLFWIEELRKTEEQCRIYLVGTKLDLTVENPRARKVLPSDVEKIAKEINALTFETSSRVGRGITELFTKIAADYVASLPPSAFIPQSSIAETFRVADEFSSAGNQAASATKKQKKKCCNN